MTTLLLADRDFVGAGILFALAIGCYLVVWAAARVGASEDRQSTRLHDLVTFHAVTPLVPVGDGEQLRCEGCQTSYDTREGCGHGHTLCGDCRLGSCDECLTDLRCQGVLSQYSGNGWWNR